MRRFLGILAGYLGHHIDISCEPDFKALPENHPNKPLEPDLETNHCCRYLESLTDLTWQCTGGAGLVSRFDLTAFDAPKVHHVVHHVRPLNYAHADHYQYAYPDHGPYYQGENAGEAVEGGEETIEGGEPVEGGEETIEGGEPVEGGEETIEGGEPVEGGEETIEGGEGIEAAEPVEGGEETIEGGEPVEGGEETIEGGEGIEAAEPVEGGEETIEGSESVEKWGSGD